MPCENPISDRMARISLLRQERSFLRGCNSRELIIEMAVLQTTTRFLQAEVQFFGPDPQSQCKRREGRRLRGNDART
jgi:hypothetical protein